MVFVAGGVFAMGDDRFYPEERPVRQVEVDGFWMDEHLVTAAEFRRFARQTKYVTVAERARLRLRSIRTPIRSCSCPARWSSARRRAPGKPR
jgi:formylglycine-generating enzyme required for sulfatase activity